jgi:hypothetical protein
MLKAILSLIFYMFYFVMGFVVISYWLGDLLIYHENRKTMGKLRSSY